MEKAENRRRFFRITDEVDLTYRVVDAHEIAKSSHITNHILGTCDLSAALASITQESTKLVHRIEKKQPELIQYLKLLEEKIDLIAQAVLSDKLTESNNTSKINLSASGLAFQCHEVLPAGAFLELKMVLASIRVLLVTCCKVIQCEQRRTADGLPAFQISADFINLSEQDRDLLIQHLVKRQMQQIRAKKYQQELK